jgi:hypothetical protein
MKLRDYQERDVERLRSAMRSGRTNMAMTLVEWTLEQVERQKPARVSPPARARKARARP